MSYSVFQDVYDKTGLSVSEVANAIVTTLIAYADAEIETITRRKFSDANAKTEFFDGSKKDILGISGNNATTINLSEYPVESITAFQVLNSDMTAAKTYTALTSVQIAAGTYYTTDYWLDTIVDPVTLNTIPYGKITLISDVFPTGRNNIKVSYTYGCAAVPTLIKELSVCMAGIRTWVYFLGGGYNRLNSYTIPQQSVDKGDFYLRGHRNILLLQEEANRILDRVGRKPRTLAFSSSADR
jgi:hypothetical protein